MQASPVAHGILACALACVAAGCGPGTGGDGPAGRGATVYATHCASCHQRDGRGVGSTHPPLAGSATVAGDRDALIAWVAFGRRPATLPPRKGLGPISPHRAQIALSSHVFSVPLHLSPSGPAMVLLYTSSCL